jgi:ABC-type multidrug transport system ATPase subunit
MTSAAVLSVTGLSRRYGAVRALDGVSFTLARGEVLGLIGPNGAGKTTLMRCLTGFEAPDAGRIGFADGRTPREPAFYLPDGATPYPELTVRRVLALFAAAFGQTTDAMDRARAALGLDTVADKRAGALSKGYRRRLLLATALLAPQPLLLLDEPFDGLDVHQTRAVAALLRNLTEAGRSLLVSVHQLRDAERICDRFALLRDGRLLALGDLDALRTRAGVSQGGLEEVFLALTEPALV